MMHYYHAFDLKIKSELLLPELLVASNISSAADIVIKFGEVSPSGLSDAASSGAFYQANSNHFWLNIPNIARFLITDGNHIIIDPSDAADEDSIRLFLLGSCMGALLMQRDLFLLHANAIKVGECCISFSGRSGIGKSTLSAAFMQRGYSVLADDVCVLNQQQEVIPGFPHIKLWADASQKLAIQTKALRQIRPNLDKFSVPLASQFYQTNLPLKLVYILNAHNKDSFEFNALDGMKKILPLKNNTYRYAYLKGLGKTKTHLKQTGTLASNVSVVRISRPKAGFQLDELVDLIEADLSHRGILNA
ncbi:MAG: hypothetical protein QNK11_07880 [Legionella sp.]|nr:hypothetical protein [Legionella sp.]